MRTILSLLTSIAVLLYTSLPPLLDISQVYAATLGALPPYLAQQDAVQLRCDQLADSPYDPQKVGSGVRPDQIDINEALPVCQQAAMRPTLRARYQYLNMDQVVGQALSAAGQLLAELPERR